MWRLTLILLFFLALLLNSCSSYQAMREPLTSPQTVAAAHYRQHGDANTLRRLAADLKPGMQRSVLMQLLGPPAYSPGDNQDYYPTELKNENGLTLTLVINYHAVGAAEAGTIEWFFLDYIGK